MRVAHFVRIQMQTFRNQIGVGIEVARRIAQKQRRKRRIVVDDDSPFAIENLAARRKDRHIADVVFFRKSRVQIALHHLQPPQSISQHQKNRKDHVLCRRQADRRYFFITAEHQTSVLRASGVRRGSDQIRKWMPFFPLGELPIIVMRSSRSGSDPE